MKKLSLALMFASPLLLSGAEENPEDKVIVHLNGTVEQTFDDSFHLNSEGDTVIVEMDTIDWFLDNPESIEEKRVRVEGSVAQTYFDEKSIRADRVTVSETGTEVVAVPDEQETVLLDEMPTPQISTATADITGTIVDIDEAQLTLESDDSFYSIDLASLPGNPRDRVGNYRLAEGMRVEVSGTFQLGFFEQGRIFATSLSPIGFVGESEALTED